MTAANWTSDAKQRSQLVTTTLAARLAVLGSFDPRRIDDGEITSVLRSCALRLQRADDREEWMLIESVRIAALAHRLLEGGPAALAALRYATEPHFDGALQTALDTWLGVLPKRPLAQYNEDDLAASSHVARWARSALVQAGLPLVTYTGPDPEDIEGRLSVLEVTRPIRWLVRHPFLGRERELAALQAYLDEPAHGTLRDDPAFCVHGIGGIGKSTLVAAFVTQLMTREAPLPWAYLDFDRRSLKPDDPFSIIADLYRQIGAQDPDLTKLTDSVRADLLERHGTNDPNSGDAHGSFREAVRAFAQTLVAEVPSPLVVVLDTCEEIQRAPGSIEQIYEVFDALAVVHGKLKLVVSGRARVPQFESASRPDRILAVGGLDEIAAVSFLQAQVDVVRGKSSEALDPGLAAAIVALVGGSPLSLALAARVLVHDDLAVITGAVDHARALGRVRDEFIRGFLYRRVLDHLQGRDAERQVWLRSVARASLALRHVTPDLIEHVLKPATHTPAEIPAGELYQDLVVEVGFVEDVGDALRLREDVRAPALDALRLEDAALVARVHDATRTFYTEHPSAPHADVERLYHALALGDVAGLIGLDRERLHDLGRSAADFPDEAAAMLREFVYGAASADSTLAQDEEQRSWERSVLTRADTELRVKNLRAARKLLFERTARTASTELHRLESRLFEAESELEDALDAARKELEAAKHANSADRVGAGAVRVAALLERMGRAADAIAVLEDADRLPLLTGNAAIRLELLLHRMNTGERTVLWSDDDRWVPGLEARRWIRVLGNRIDANPTLTRLLAAALGRDELAYVRRTLQRVGLGVDAAPQWIDDLTREIVRWDADVGDTLGSAAGLIGPRQPQHWRDRISVLGTTAGDLLSKLWSVEAPPPQVCEAIRAFYLWWAIPFVATERRSARHFLEELPLDFSRKKVGEFERLILTGYPKSNDLRDLCRTIGIDGGRFDFAQPARYVIRDLLDEIARRGRLPTLVERALAALPASASEALRTLVGSDWAALHVRHTILFLAVNPAGTSPLALDEEARSIQQELERSGHRDQFELVTRWAVQPLDLLRELRKLRPTVVHYSGHGAQEGLVFHGADRQTHMLSPEALAEMFRAAGSSVRVVMLSACYTESSAEALLPHVDCVVGTQGAIEDTAAAHFAVGFYGALGEGESVAAGVRQGQAAMVMGGFRDTPPLLQVRAGVDANRLILAGNASRALH